MLRRVDNPPNPYHTNDREWLEEAPPVEIEVYEEHAKTILAQNDSPDVGFQWSVNPYRGCQHACAYCYARRTHEYLDMGAGTDFDTKLVAKINAPELLRAAFSKKKWVGDSVVFSGVTDCYQPIESVYRLTRQCLEVCLEFRNRISIITKSYLVMRDAELLAELHHTTGATVYQSIPYADDKMAKLIEPYAPSPTRRFDAMKRLCDAGVAVGVMVAPIIPGLNDKEIAKVLKRAAEMGARSAGYVPLRLPGSVAPVFMSRIKEAMPLRAARIEARIREMRGGKLNDPRFKQRMRGKGEYWDSIRALFRVAAEKYGFNQLKPKSQASKRFYSGTAALLFTPLQVPAARKPVPTTPNSQMTFRFE